MPALRRIRGEAMSARSQTDKRKKVLLVDDHEIMRQGLEQLLCQEDDLTVCGQAEDIPGAMDCIRKLSPDVVIADISLKGGSGLDLIKDIQVHWPNLPVLVLSMHDELIYAERVLRAGAKGYVSKSEVSTRVVEGVREVLAGGLYISDAVSRKLLRGLVGKDPGPASPVDALSDREFEVFELIGQGMQMRDIAARLHLSVKTVEAHREHIKKKFDLDSANELLTYAVRWTQLERGN
jgi:DNA-binding NarL/FixJ family response regulator